MRLRAVNVATMAVLVAGGIWSGNAQAQAQTTDLERCEALNTLYERHLGKRGSEGQQSTNLEAKGAIDQCRRGNTAEGIRALEKTLRANGFRI